MSVEIETGIPGGVQESSFGNATLQGVGTDEGEFRFDVSIATHVEVPDVWTETEEALAAYLGGLLRQIAREHPELSFEVQIGPFGDGDDQ